MDETSRDAAQAPTFDTAAAVTRSLLGWGVVAGPLYLAVGLALALTRDGFDLAEHQLSLLMLGDGGWMQRANLALSGVLVLVAAVGVRRAADARRTRAAAWLVGVMAVGLLGSAAFPPDPMAGFPPGAAEATTVGGTLHLVLGLVTFGAAGAAALTFPARWSTLVGVVILAGFLGGAVLATSAAGVALLWVAVVASYAWLAAASVVLYRRVPHPDGTR